MLFRLGTILMISYGLISAAHAGVWTLKKGEAYLQLSLSYMVYNSLFNEDRSSTTLARKVTDLTYQLYGEYGLTDKLTLIALVPMKYVATGSEIFTSDFKEILAEASLSGFSNVALALKYALIQKTYHVSVQLRADANSQVADLSSGLQTGYQSWMYNPSLLVGRGYEHMYWTTEAGLRFRENGYSTSWHAGIELGYSKTGKTWLAVVVDDVESLKDGGRQDGNVLHTGLYTNDQESFTYGGKLIHYLGKKIALHLAVYGAFAGNQVPHYPSLNLGFSYEWKK